LEENVVEVESHQNFVKWREQLKDVEVEALIAARLRRIQEDGFLGDHAFVTRGVYELRIHYGPGYRLYYTWMSGRMILLLCGGDKSRQKRDIKRARRLAKEVKREKGK